MTHAEFSAWLEETIPHYADDKVASGQWSRAEALEKSRGEFARLLPAGLETSDHFFRAIVDEAGARVGVLWFARSVTPRGDVAFVYDVAIEPDARRKGHAAAAFAALEREVVELGMTGVGLHVFGHNHAARALYEKLGFTTTDVSLFKALGETPKVD